MTDKTYTEDELWSAIRDAKKKWKESHFQFKVDQTFIKVGDWENSWRPRLVIEMEGGDPTELWQFGLDLEKQIIEFARTRYQKVE